MASPKKSVPSPRERARVAKAAQDQERKTRDRRVEALVTRWYSGIDRREKLQAQVDANETRLAGMVATLCDTEGEPVTGAAQLLDLTTGQVQALRARHKKHTVQEQDQDAGKVQGDLDVALVPATDEAEHGADDSTVA